MSDLTVRAAMPRDANALSRLAAPDGRGHMLLADRGGVAIAALALTNGSVFTDPVHDSTDAVSLLRRRRYQLLRQGGDVGAARSLLRRLAPSS